MWEVGKPNSSKYSKCGGKVSVPWRNAVKMGRVGNFKMGMALGVWLFVRILKGYGLGGS
jgi:hypothetical protein